MKNNRGFLRYLLFVTVLLLMGPDPATGKDPARQTDRHSTKKVHVIGHRGAAGLAPENTLSAVEKALKIGVDGFEIDVLMTADRELVVHHDYRLTPDIARKPDGEWLERGARPVVKDLTLAELKTYDVGRLRPYSPYTVRYPEQQPADGERIPTLREVISLLNSRADEKTQLWVEIKTSPTKPELTPPPEVVADAVVRILRRENIIDRSLVLSFDWRSLLHVQKIEPRIRTVYLSTTSVRSDTIQSGKPGASPWTAGFDVDEFNGSIPRTIKAAGGRYWAAGHNQVTPSLIKDAHEMDIRIYVWTVDSRYEMERLVKMGVDGIITNRPDILMSILGGS
jgi:glycerophosphoryl diester phosphodiesterase